LVLPSQARVEQGIVEAQVQSRLCVGGCNRLSVGANLTAAFPLGRACARISREASLVILRALLADCSAYSHVLMGVDDRWGWINLTSHAKDGES